MEIRTPSPGVIGIVLKGWMIDDGEVGIPRHGDPVRADLALAVESSRLPQDHESNHIAAVGPEQAGRVTMVGSLVVVTDGDGRVAGHVIDVGNGVRAAWLGAEQPPPTSRVRAEGTLLIEPYLWSAGGVFDAAVRPAGGVGLVREVHRLGGSSDGEDDRILVVDLGAREERRGSGSAAAR